MEGNTSGIRDQDKGKSDMNTKQPEESPLKQNIHNEDNITTPPEKIHEDESLKTPAKHQDSSHSSDESVSPSVISEFNFNRPQSPEHPKHLRVHCSKQTLEDLKSFYFTSPDHASMTPLQIVNRFNALMKPKKVFLQDDIAAELARREKMKLNKNQKRNLRRKKKALENGDATSSNQHIFITPPKHGMKRVDQ